MPNDQSQPLSLEITNEKVLDVLCRDDLRDKNILDLGAGEGFFTRLLYDRMATEGLDPERNLVASDIAPADYLFEKIPCQYGDFNAGLPYEDASFDRVCSIEVIEHLEDQFKYLREIRRILKPSGALILTTPNILNINSRLRYLGCGLYPLFDILPNGDDVASCAGHIHPISYIYLSHVLKKTGFESVELYFDRRKKSALIWATLLYPLLAAIKCARFSSLKRKSPEVYAENIELIGKINSLDMLTSRTIIVKATK